MATWKETLEPYIKVVERVKTATINPTAGESLIIGCVFISDAGPSVPTLITSQKEFLATYASKDLSQEYVESLDQLYSGENKKLASTMWANAYRLAGSNTILAVRAAKADTTFVKPMAITDDTYIVKEGELLKRVSPFKIVIQESTDQAEHDFSGWNISISDAGAVGNCIGVNFKKDEVLYDIQANNIEELVNVLNESSKFFSPSFDYYKKEGDEFVICDPSEAIAVVFNEAYMGSNIIDKSNSKSDKSDGSNNGMINIVTEEWNQHSSEQRVIDLNSDAWSGFEVPDWYAANVYNSLSELKVRIRRFNHDAVVTKEITDTKSLTKKSNSPYTVLTSVLDTFTKHGTVTPSPEVLKKDFFEIAIYDQSINEEVSFFNVGSFKGLGDMELSEVNGMLSMIQLVLPEDLHELGLNYFDYDDELKWEELEGDDYPDKSVFFPVAGNKNKIFTSETEFKNAVDIEAKKKVKTVVEGTYWGIGTINQEEQTVVLSKCYKYVKNGEQQIFQDLAIDPTETELLNISDSDLKRSLDLIGEDEVYVVEGLCDLGNTDPSFQNYMANMAISELNYFYPMSTINSSNYMAVGNGMSKISVDSYKLYALAPWDIDTGNLGWKYYASPSVMYWELVAKNRRAGREYAPAFGMTNGVISYQRPVKEFNKKQRQLLLSKKVNTVSWNTQIQNWTVNDNYTKETENNILSDDGNSRLHLHISKNIPTLLRQFIGKRISVKLCSDVVSVIEYWIKTTILPLEYTLDAYQVFCEYDEVLARQNKIKVVVNARYQRSLKIITVYNDSFDVGMDISSAE